ncbi:MAG: Gfo/Idh/MocA family oxidoreductase [Chloroflexi bacterium]|nr:Gfo/Idh/MocA family oxidoreductase [Chloroflexota bacterium]
MGQQIVFAHEAKERLRVAMLGTSGHAFRNYLPVLPFLPVEYVAQWDPDVEKARAFARQFGAGDAAYDDAGRLLREHQPEAVWIATDELEADGRTIQPRLIAECLDAGCHVFCDKPIASTADEVRELIGLRNRSGKVVAVGAKTMHYPTHTKLRQIVDDPAAGFGELVSLTVRYPLHLPPRGGLPFSDPARRSCLGHVWHPAGAALRIGGPLARVHVFADQRARNGVVAGHFRGGAVVAFHFPRTKSGLSPLEHLEAVGEGANAVVENAARVTYYRKASAGAYGRMTDMLTELTDAPVRWEPELSLGTLYNNHNFIQGYAQSLLHFIAAVKERQPVTVGTLEDALEIMKVHEALCEGPGGVVELASA